MTRARSSTRRFAAADGTFDIRVPLQQPADVSIAITPEADPASLRKSQSQVTAFKASDWQRGARW